MELLEHFMGDCMGLDLKSRAGLFESQLTSTLDQKLTNVVIFLEMFFTSYISCKLSLLNLKQKAKQYKQKTTMISYKPELKFSLIMG